MTERKIKVGLLGVGRGLTLWQYCVEAQNAELVAVCDRWEQGLANAKEKIKDEKVTYYTDFDEFLKHDMDAVFLANYATEHAPFAVKAMKAGKDVISEVLPCQTMSEAVELVECIEQTGRKYFYAENYSYMNGPYEMREKYLNGELGEFEYGEGEYMHNCESGWADITYGDPKHWRNNMSAFYYCTHSAGPLLHITGLRPVKVVGLEGTFNARMARMGAKAGHMGVEMVTLENGAIIKSIHGVGPSKESIWYSVYGSKGRMETARYETWQNNVNTLYANLDDYEGMEEDHNRIVCYHPRTEIAKKGAHHGHNGSDYVCFRNAFEYLLGNPEADPIEIYEALDSWMIGHFAYLSVLEGGNSLEIPDLRDPQVRELYRNDRRCTDPAVAGDQLLPSYSKGNPDIPDSVYEGHKAKWEKK